jgi:glucokinase
MRFFLTADFGGTQIRTAAFAEDSLTPVAHLKIPTRGDGTTIERLVSALRNVTPPQGEILALGVSAAGFTDAEQGMVYATNIHDMHKFPLRQALADALHLPVFIGNDANLAALGEWRFGAGKGCRDLLYLTVSTGIGGGVIANNQLLLGRHGLAAELGHIILVENGPLCACGRRGCLEAISSGTGIANYVREQLALGQASSLANIPQPTARDVAAAAPSGDKLAVDALTRAGTYLGLAIANYIAIFNPQIIILGGSVTNSGDFLFKPMHAAIQANILSPVYLEDLTITTAELGDNVGLLGALALAQMSL